MIAKMLPQKQIKQFQKEILDWYEKNKRDLPWRHSRDPYTILISEVMLQQTQVSRVISKFSEWMEKFPTLEKLAQASTRDVLQYWNGLGYNRRALYLQKAAQQLVERHSGKRSASRINERSWTGLRQGFDRQASQDDKLCWPKTEEELKKLPGIGEYTARAILCFAFDEQIAVVDTNVRKVILTRFKKKEMLKQVQHDSKEIQDIADQLLPKDKAYGWNQALMDYASAMLKKEKIPIPKQSHFKTSNRFYRGQVIRLLLEHNSTLVTSLFEKIENNGIDFERFVEIVKGMEKDGLVICTSEQVSLP